MLYWDPERPYAHLDILKPPKGARLTHKNLVRRALAKRHTSTVEGKQVSMTVEELLLRSIIQAALKGKASQKKKAHKFLFGREELMSEHEFIVIFNLLPRQPTEDDV